MKVGFLYCCSATGWLTSNSPSPSSTGKPNSDGNTAKECLAIEMTTEAEIKAALKRAKALEHEPRALSVEHIPALRLLIVSLSNQRRLVLPIEDIQGLGQATPEQLQNYEFLGRGTGICFPDLDVDLYVPVLIEGIHGNRSWMAQLGRKRRQGHNRSQAFGGAIQRHQGGKAAARCSSQCVKMNRFRSSFLDAQRKFPWRINDLAASGRNTSSRDSNQTQRQEKSPASSRTFFLLQRMSFLL